ncbi:MAG: dicarboxylate/amino acid:cation symporter [Planctomycetes bacterium]|nr:dicarboxylate/amino acid:cation symporter [Planctomycetota bacterium]
MRSKFVAQSAGAKLKVPEPRLGRLRYWLAVHLCGIMATPLTLGLLALLISVVVGGVIAISAVVSAFNSEVDNAITVPQSLDGFLGTTVFPVEFLVAPIPVELSASFVSDPNFSTVTAEVWVQCRDPEQFPDTKWMGDVAYLATSDPVDVVPGGGSAEATIGGEQSLPGVFMRLLNNMIPQNPIHALANGDFLSIITFSILMGLFIIRVGGKSGETMRNFFQSGFDVMMSMTMFIIKLAPIGVLSFMLYATASQGLSIFVTFGWYLLTVFLALAFHACVVLPLILKFVARRSPWEFAKSMSPALLTAFSTASSNGTLPLTMTSVEERAGVSNKVSSFVLPLGATINMDGTALYEAVAVLFIAQSYLGALTLEQQIIVAVTALLASVGAAGIPSAGLVMMAIVLQAVGLPLEAQGLIIAVDRVLDMCRTSVNVWSDSCGCAVLERLEGSAGTDESRSTSSRG